ncbi:hypothetical protein ANCCAN_27325, partial [Ancylostoma caninum]
VYRFFRSRRLSEGNLKLSRDARRLREEKVWRYGTSIHLINIFPQLQLILNRTIDILVDGHMSIHGNRLITNVRKDVFNFPVYKEGIETHQEFESRSIIVVLTINFDGVKVSKLNRNASLSTPLIVTEGPLQRS